MNMTSNRQAWLWIAILLAVIIIFSFVITSPQPKEYPAFVSESPSPSGTKAIYTYLENANQSVSRWTHAPELLPNGRNQLLIMIEPYFIPPQEESNAYIQFMKEGTSILLFSENPKGMFELKSVPIEGGFLEGILMVTGKDGTEYQAEVSSYVRLDADEQDEIIWYDDRGVLAYKSAYGSGQLIVSNAPNWMANETILNADHVSLVLSLVNEANANVILFDEYIHGQHNAPAMTSLYPQWFLLWMLQGLLLLMLWLWNQGKRFGPTLMPREEFVRFSDEGIRALAAWHLRGRRYQDSIQIQADSVKHLLQDKWGIPYSKQWEDSSDQLERKWNKPLTEIKAFINSLRNVLQREKISKQEYLLWSRQLDQLRKEVEER